RNGNWRIHEHGSLQQPGRDRDSGDRYRYFSASHFRARCTEDRSDEVEGIVAERRQPYRRRYRNAGKSVGTKDRKSKATTKTATATESRTKCSAASAGSVGARVATAATA